MCVCMRACVRACVRACIGVHELLLTLFLIFRRILLRALSSA